MGAAVSRDDFKFLDTKYDEVMVKLIDEYTEEDGSGLKDALAELVGDKYYDTWISAAKRRDGGKQSDKVGKTQEFIDMVFYDPETVQLLATRALRKPSGNSWPWYNHPSDHECVMIY